MQYIESVRGGKNSIDFQIITELGVLVGKQEADYAYVISQDKGYAASIDALRARYADAFQEVALRPSIESCLHLAFMRRASTAAELKEGLMREYRRPGPGPVRPSAGPVLPPCPAGKGGGEARKTGPLPPGRPPQAERRKGPGTPGRINGKNRRAKRHGGFFMRRRCGGSAAIRW